MRQVLRRHMPEGVKKLVRPARTRLRRAFLPRLPLFDLGYYLAANPDIAAGGMDPAVHFWRHGVREGRWPHAFFSPDYVYSQLDRQSHAGTRPVTAYAGSGLSLRPRLLFVSHDASRTGAPAIILRLLEMFSRSGQFECFSILDEAGERLPEFRALSHTHVMTQSRRGKAWSDGYAGRELAPHFGPDGVFARNPPVCALVNSAESYPIGRALAAFGVPVVSLVHELAVYYPPEVFADIVGYSKRTVFPSRFVSRVAAAHSRFDLAATTVRGQGLLEDGFGALDRDRCRSLLRERLGLPEDTLVVLSVGTVDIRKGADLFVETARLFLAAEAGDRPVAFVWFGATAGTMAFVRDIAGPEGLDDRIRFLPATAEIEEVFVGGDVFLHVARADPFPCVIHEAMACGLPVIAFRNGGGAPELIGDSTGTVVEMGDLAAMAGAIRRYADDPDLRRAHGEAARRHIATDWDYRSYLDDIYAMIRDVIPHPPRGGWPALPHRPEEAHLVVMRGCLGDLRLLDRMSRDIAPDRARIAVIDGRFGRDVDAVVAALQAKGWRFTVCQPVDDTAEARVTRLNGLLRNPKPRRVTLINTLGLMSHRHLALLPFPVQAVVTDDPPADTELIRALGSLDRLYLADQTAVARLGMANLQAADRLHLLTDLPKAANGDAT